MKFMALGPEVKIQDYEGGTILYDGSRASNASPGWLDASWWAKRGTVSAAEEGRGAAYMIEADGRSLVLRHYRRGGLVARIGKDRYFWRGADRTRSFHEWHLLYLMQRAALPVPLPIAAGYRRNGWTYTADLLVERIPAVRTLAAALKTAPVSLGVWVAIGRCLRNFHAHGIYHADLNAHNILLGKEESEVWLIDFDRGAVRLPGWWSDANLVRLQRSLQKLSAALGGERFSAADWQALVHSYFSNAIQTRSLQIPVAG